jgi:hypothetical protein
MSPATHAPTTLTGHLPQGRIEIDVEWAEVAPEHLFTFATRNNPKRPFLFLSHVLGKHLPASPASMAAVHERIAAHIPYLPEPVLFIGMAETATCLGQGVFEAWQRAHAGQDARFLHTTRHDVDIAGADPIVFEESHSHAPIQWFFEPVDPLMKARFATTRSLVLIDDEISTGNTFLNLARACRQRAPGIRCVHLATITDFTGPARAALSTAFALPITFGALLYGQWRFVPEDGAFPLATPASSQTSTAPRLTDPGLGRLGRINPLSLDPATVAALATRLRPTDRVLFLGTGEFMHPAFVLAQTLQRMTQAQVFMHATTRSPILAWGAIRNTLAFPDNYGEGITNYLYNVGEHHYEHIFLCHETHVTEGLRELARRLDATLLRFHSETHIEEIALH